MTCIHRMCRRTEAAMMKTAREASRLQKSRVARIAHLHTRCREHVKGPCFDDWERYSQTDVGPQRPFGTEATSCAAWIRHVHISDEQERDDMTNCYHMFIVLCTPDLCTDHQSQRACKQLNWHHDTPSAHVFQSAEGACDSVCRVCA